MDWAIQSALDSGVFDGGVYVSTDADDIAEEGLKSGALIHRRAAETATSTASSESAITDFMAAHPEADVVCMIQATSPLTTPDDFKDAMKLFNDSGADSLVTAVRAHRFMWSVGKDGVASAKNYVPATRPRRQDWDGEMIENGAFYLFTAKSYKESGCRLSGRIACFEMAEHNLTEIDSMVDWEVIEVLAGHYGYQPKEQPKAKKAKA